MKLSNLAQSLLTTFAFSVEGRPMNTQVPVLSKEVLDSFQIGEDGQGHACPNVLVFDAGRMTHIECTVWIYPKGVYDYSDDSFIITDVSSDSITHDRLMKQRERTDEEVDYGKYIRHMRRGIIRGSGKAILTRAEVIECLQTKRYTVS